MYAVMEEEKKEIEVNIGQKVDQIIALQNNIDSISRIVIDVNEVNQSINQTLFIKDNFLVDMQNFSVMTLPRYSLETI